MWMLIVFSLIFPIFLRVWNRSRLECSGAFNFTGDDFGGVCTFLAQIYTFKSPLQKKKRKEGKTTQAVSSTTHMDVNHRTKKQETKDDSQQTEGRTVCGPWTVRTCAQLFLKQATNTSATLTLLEVLKEHCKRREEENNPRSGSPFWAQALSTFTFLKQNYQGPVQVPYQ